MPKYAAFLRAVNLGSHRRVNGAQLKSLFEGMGFDDVAAFRTSGNVAFAGPQEYKLAEQIEATLARELGYEVPIFLRTQGQMRAIAQQEPFDAEVVAASKGKLQVLLLGKQPATPTREAVLALASDDDRLTFGDRELYWLPSGGTQQSVLNFKAIEKLLGPSTTRTKGTIEQMAAKFFD